MKRRCSHHPLGTGWSLGIDHENRGRNEESDHQWRKGPHLRYWKLPPSGWYLSSRPDHRSCFTLEIIQCFDSKNTGRWKGNLKHRTIALISHLTASRQSLSKPLPLLQIHLNYYRVYLLGFDSYILDPNLPLVV